MTRHPDRLCNLYNTPSPGLELGQFFHESIVLAKTKGRLEYGIRASASKVGMQFSIL